MDLPLHFRWIRRVLKENARIIAWHQDETVWYQRRLWLQQFGLRTVDGFLFNDLQEAGEWLKVAAILPRQELIEFPAGARIKSIQQKQLVSYLFTTPQ